MKGIWIRSRRWLGLGAITVAIAACANPTANEQKTDGEWIRESLVTDNDAILAFSANWLANQVGTPDFSRTIDSIRRGFVGTRFFTDTVETQSAKQAFDATVYDSVWGTINYRVGFKLVSYSYRKLLYAGKAKLLRLGASITHPNPWWLWRMEYRFGGQPGVGSPIIEAMTVSSGGVTESILPRKQIRLFRDSVLTVPSGAMTDVTVSVRSVTHDDSFFVTYPRDGIYFTEAMAHDSLDHTATVQIRSTARFDVIGVQGFKRRSFESESVGGATAASVQTALVRFFTP